MERRWLGQRDLSVPVLTLGTASFAPGPWSGTDAAQARRLVDLWLELGVNMFDTANVYANGNAEVTLGCAIQGRRDKVLISTTDGLRSGPGEHDVGCSRRHLLEAVDGSLRRLPDLLPGCLRVAERYSCVEQLATGGGAARDIEA